MGSESPQQVPGEEAKERITYPDASLGGMPMEIKVMIARSLLEDIKQGNSRDAADWALPANMAEAAENAVTEEGGTENDPSVAHIITINEAARKLGVSPIWDTYSGGTIIGVLAASKTAANRPQIAADRTIISTLWALCRINSAYFQVCMSFLYEANNLTAMRAQARLEKRWFVECPVGPSGVVHIGPCTEPEDANPKENGIQDVPFTIKSEPRCVRSALDWICHLDPSDEKNEKAVENVWEHASQYCQLRHVHIAIREGSYALANRMLDLPPVQKELHDLNDSVYKLPPHQNWHGSLGANAWYPRVVSPSHPIFPAVSRPLLPAVGQGSIQLVQRLLPKGSPDLVHCRSRGRSIVTNAARSGQIDMLRLLLDHADTHTDSPAIPSRRAASALWGAVQYCEESKRGPVLVELSRRCRGRAWLASLLWHRANRPSQSDHSLTVLTKELIWNDLFDLPEEEWEVPRSPPLRETWDSWVDQEVWLREAVRSWEVSRVEKMLRRFRDPNFINVDAAPRDISRHVVRAACRADPGEATEIMRRLLDYQSENLGGWEVRIHKGCLTAAMVVAVSEANTDLIKLLNDHGVQIPQTVSSAEVERAKKLKI